MSQKAKVCVITGVGPGTGRALAERFASGGYQIAMIARDEKRLAEIAQSITGAASFPCDASDLAALEKTISRIQKELGDPHIVLHNAVSATMGSFMEVEAKAFEKNFRVNTVALLRLAQLTAPAMIARGEGVILGTGNTSAYRGKASFAGFAPTKAAQRILLESIARDLGPKGIHAAYVAVDAVIDVPWTRAVFKDRPDNFFCRPADIAEECYRIAHQAKSAWSSDVVIRPYCEEW